MLSGMKELTEIESLSIFSRQDEEDLWIQQAIFLKLQSVLGERHKEFQQHGAGNHLNHVSPIMK